jgi:aminopeptidase N
VEGRAFRGRATNTLVPLGEGLDRLALDCGSNLRVESVSVGEPGRNCEFRQEGETLIIRPGRTLRAGEPVDVTAIYAGTPRKGITFAPAYAGRPPFVWTNGEPDKTLNWLPCYNRPDDHATSETVVTVPRSWTAVSNGRLVSRKDNGDGTATFHWRIGVPHASYLISFAAGEMTTFREEVDGLPVEYVVPRGTDEATVRRALGRTPAILRFFSGKLGVPYPYEKYAQVCVPDYSSNGLENVSATTLDAGILRDEVAFQEGDSDGLVAHELAHQWFGNLVGFRDWDELWLSEAFASYMAALYTGHAGSGEDLSLWMSAYLARYLRNPRSHNRAVVRPYGESPYRMFDLATYVKGACVLHALRGELGDEAWWEGVRRYLGDHRGQAVTTAALRRSLEAASGRDLGWFFDQWVYRGGHPKLAVGWKFDAAGQVVRVTVEQTQGRDLPGSPAAFRLTTSLAVTSGGRTRTVPVVIDRVSQSIEVPASEAPQLVRIDPEGWLPKQVRYDRRPEEWVYQLRHPPDAAGRLEAASVVAGWIGSDKPGAERELAAAWKRESKPVARAFVIEQLARLTPADTGPLREAARDASGRVRVAAVEGLVKGQRTEADEAALRAVWSDPRECYTARAAALRGLAAWGVGDRERLLKEARATHSEDEVIAAAALEITLREGGPDAADLAVRALRYGQPQSLRRAAILGAGHLYTKRPAVRRALSALIDDPDPWIRSEVWDALAGLGATDALPALEERLSREKERYFPEDLKAAVAALRAATRNDDPSPKPGNDGADSSR